VYDAVLICSGLYDSPAIPFFPGRLAYQGQLLHSRDYKGPEGFEGKQIVVVGAGSSAADIAVELSRVASSLTLSTQRGAWFIPRYISGKPYDHQLTRLSTLIPFRARMWVFQRMLLSEYRRIGIKQPQKALKSVLPVGAMNILGGRTTVSSDLPRRIASGAIQVRPSVARIEEQQVVFTDGTRSQADVILLATGYRMGFPFLDGVLGEASGNRLDLYKHVFHPHWPGLAFLGMCIVAGSVIPVIEMQARWVAQVLAGAATLPPPAQMERVIHAWNAWMTSVGAQPMRVELLEYMDELAELIGARPHIARHLRLALDILAGPPVPAQYRLQGPGRWNHAGRTIRATRRRRGAVR
jgi:dimethylaniline monooxygenase (N-oxide forming)